LTADGDKDDIRSIRGRLPLLIALMVAALIVALLIGRFA